TTPEMFAKWMGPEGSEVLMEEMNLTLGGKLAFTVKIGADGPEFRLFGFYEEIEPPSRLVHSWAMDGDDEVSTVVFELEPHGEGTRLQLTHHGLSRPEEVGQNEAGWVHQLDRLEALFA
ncbi:MAG: SRPBCC domain-containing protein, partial [Acidimicrobiia bacterium]